MFTLLLAALAQVAAPPATKADDIIVVGNRAEKELAACLARNCPPAEEVEKSLQASVEQFGNARYDDAQATLQRAIRRNRRYAAYLPGPVSSLYATLATVAEHQGREGLWRSAARENVALLRQYVGETKPETLQQELAFADTTVGLQNFRLASDMYRSIQEKAAGSGQRDLAATSAFRRAWLAMLEERDDQAVRLADQAVAIAGPENKITAQLGQILRARIAIRRGDKGAVDQLAATLRQSATTTPRMLWQPKLEDLNLSRDAGFANANTALKGSDLMYADVGYWIRPDGHTSGIEILRTSGLGQWSNPITRQVSRRRYIPLDLPSSSQGIYRIDRFTVRAAFDVPTGSRLAQRMGRMDVHIIDLTDTDAMAAAARERTSEAATAQPATIY